MTRPSTKSRAVLSPGAIAPEDVVVWNWPLRDERLQSWIVLAIAVALVALVVAVWRDPLFTVLAAVALAVALWRLWLPVKWELGLAGVTQTALGIRRRIAWMSIARFTLADEGVWLYADRQPSPFRGVYIAYNGQRERITACVEYYLGTWTAADSTHSFHESP